MGEVFALAIELDKEATQKLANNQNLHITTGFQ